MAIELEGLEFKVEGLSGTSTKGLEDLTNALSGLKSALPTKAKIFGVATGISQLSNAFAQLSTHTKTMGRFAAAMGNLRQARVSPGLVKNLESLATSAAKFADLSDEAITKIERLSAALKGLRGVGRISLAVPRSAVAEQNPAAALAETGNMASRTVSNVRAFFANIEEGAKRAAGAVSKVAKGFGKIGSTVFALPKFFTGEFASGITTAVKKVGELFAGLKRIAMYRLMRTAIKLFTQGLSEGLKNVYAYSQLVGTSFASNMDLIATNALYAKNSLGAMAAPLLNAIAPAVDYVTDKFVELFNVVNMFIARLTGAETATIAKKAATTWGDATEDAAGRGRQAVEELKRTILGFDELNVLQDNKDKGSGSGSGSGGGADVSSMFEQVPIESSISEFADRLKEAFQNGSWTEVGQIIGNKFNEIVEDVPWGTIGSKIGNGIDAAIQIVYSTLTSANFVALGEKFATLFNATILQIDFEVLGELMVKRFTIIGDLLIGAITKVNWGMVASKASDYVIGIFKELASWIQSVNWSELTLAIFDGLINAVKGVKFGEITATIVEFWGSALGAISSIGVTILNLIKEGICGAIVGIGTWIGTNIIDPFVNAFKSDDVSLLDAGKMVFENIKNGIVGAVTGIATWVYEKVWLPFWNGFKSAFGFSGDTSNSKTLLDMGADIIKAIMKGITDWIAGISTWLSTNVVTPLTTAWNEFWKDPLGFAVDFIANLTGWDKDKSFSDNITGMVSSFANWVKEGGFSGTITGMISSFKEWVKGTKFGDTVTGMISSFGEWVKGTKFGNTVTGMISSFKEWAKGTNFKDTVSGMVSSFTDWVKGSAFGNTVGGMISSFKEWAKGTAFGETIDGMVSVFGKWDKEKTFAENVTGMVSSFKSWAKDKDFGNTVSGMVSSFKSWIKDGAFSGTITGMISSFAGWIKEKGFIGTIGSMISSFASWTKDAKYSSTLTGMISSFAGWIKATGFITTITGMISSFGSWAKGTGFSSTIGSMVSSFTSWVRGKGFANTIGSMVSSFASWAKEKGFGTTISDMVASFKSWSKGKDFGNTVTNMIAKFKKWSKGGTFSSNVDNMIAKFQDWTKGGKFSSIINNMIAKLVSISMSGLSSSDKEIELTGRINDLKVDTSAGYTVHIQKALGGAYYSGNWHNIPQYASGGIPSHGTMFVAGEAGAEAVANINGRTEVLNASQLASAIHAAVLSAMQQANGSQSPMLNVTVRTEDNEVLARAVAKGQRSLDARLNPTAAY